MQDHLWRRPRRVRHGRPFGLLGHLSQMAATSGGLVFGVPRTRRHGVTGRLREAGDHAAVIGSVRQGSGQI